MRTNTMDPKDKEALNNAVLEVFTDNVEQFKKELKEEVTEQNKKFLETLTTEQKEWIEKVKALPAEMFQLQVPGGRQIKMWRKWNITKQGRELLRTVPEYAFVKDQPDWEDYKEWLVKVVSALRNTGRDLHDDQIEARQWLKEQKKDLSEGVATAGGYLVPPEYEDYLLAYAYLNSVALQEMTIVDVAGIKVYIPTEATRPNVYWIDEGAEKTEDEPTFGQVEIDIKKLCGYTEVTNELLQDSIIDIVSLLTKQFGHAIGQGLDTAFFTGTGTGGQDPFTGALQCAEWSEPMDVSDVCSKSCDTTGITYVLIDAVHKIPDEAMSGNMKFYFNREMLGKIRQARSTTGNLQLVTMLESMKDTLLGYPVRTVPALPRSATPHQRFGLFGDLKAYIIARRAGAITIESNPWLRFKNDITAFRTVCRYGGACSTLTKKIYAIQLIGPY